MALPSSRAYIRTDYIVDLERANLNKIFVELYVYTGTLTTDKPSDYTVRLTADAFPSAAGNKYAYVNIAPYCRDYIEPTYAGSSVSSAVWIEYDLYYADDGDTSLTLEGSYDLTGLDGYGYFEDGANYTGSTRVLMTGDYVVNSQDKGVSIPVLQDNLTQFILARFSVQLYSSGPLSTTENTANVIYYANTALAPTADRAIFKFSSGNDVEINIRYLTECRNEVVRVSFVNRFGAVQDILFFGKLTKSLNTESTMFKRNLLNEGSYVTQRHQNSILTKNGINTITLNSGNYPEDSNATFEELFLSEQVWLTLNSDVIDGAKIDNTETVYPVNIKDSSVQYKTRLYDKLINYTINFEVANDKISTVT